ncbi:UNVERIFIED_CONTAM: hypothetical protein GTU68_060424, partial [Idotea baltica]|nr:hypothetical protein [Idotea baltica]
PLQNATSTDSPRQTNAKRSFAFSQSLEELKSTPLAPSLSQSPSTQQSQRYSLRTNSGAVVASFGPNADTTKWEANFEYSPQIKLVECGGDSPLTSSYKFMFEKLRDCADVLDDTIYHLGNQILKSKDIEETVNLRTTSNDAIWCVGRICCDSLGKLNAASVLLEGDRETCSGATVKLDLSRLGHYALFPGQIVAVKGINSTGECLVAEEIVIGKILESPKCSNLNNDGLQIRIACGPFTTLENLLYEPLMDLLQDVVENPPHVLFLLGPMLDSSHPSLEDPLLSDSYDSILARCFDKIDSALVNTDVKVYVVTSLRDVCCSSIYPTPPVLLSAQMTVGSKIQLLSDPSLLDIGGLHIGLTTIDFPMQMSREEISYFPQGSDRLGRLARHMLLQQSFYPIYPPPEGICLNIEQADIHARLPFTPHIMITPSDLKGYVKDVEGCLFINPERLTKGKTGGCHCKLEVKPSTQQQRP